jgi:YHS domain-containing protein
MMTSWTKLSLAALGLVSALALTGCAHKCGDSCNCAKTPASSALPPGVKASGEATVGDRSLCPVSGEEFTITAASPKTVVDGKTYYFCCPGCDKKFAANPAQYLKK